MFPLCCLSIPNLCIFAKGKRSNSINVIKSNRNLPLILKPELDYYSVGDTLSLSGQHFSDDTLVFIDNIKTKTFNYKIPKS
eukprot:UN23453